MPRANHQRVTFHERYFADIVCGRKTTSVRWNEGSTTGPAVFYCGDHEIPGAIVSVSRVRLCDAKPSDLHAPPGTDVREFADALRRNYYPEMPSDALVDVIEFVAYT